MSDLQLSAKDYKGLNLVQLNALINRQLSAKQKWADKAQECRVAMATLTTNIHNIREWVNTLKDPAPLPQICDHAILRYLERIENIDMSKVREALDFQELRECVKRCPTGRHTINDIIYVTDHGALVTILYGDNHPTMRDNPSER